MIEDGDTDEFNEAIKGFDIKSYGDLQVKYVCIIYFYFEWALAILSLNNICLIGKHAEAESG